MGAHTVTSDLIKLLASLAERKDFLDGIVVTATLDGESGKLGKVEGFSEKLTAAINHKDGGATIAFAVASEDTELWNAQGMRSRTRETVSPRLLRSDNFANLVAQLVCINRFRPGVEPCSYDLVLGDSTLGHNYVGREWLFNRVEQCLSENDRGFIWITAGPRFGKTEFLFKLIERYRDARIADAILGGWHFFRKNQPNWVDVIDMVKQLEWRLRVRLGCPLDAKQLAREVIDENAAEILQKALVDAVSKGKRLLLVIDGIGQSFGDTAAEVERQRALLLQILPGPKELPKGVFILFAAGSAPDSFGWGVADRTHINVCNDSTLKDENNKDLYAYLYAKLVVVTRTCNVSVAQVCELAERMRDKCEGSFGAAELFAIRFKDNLTGWLSGAPLPDGIADAAATNSGVGGSFPWLWRDLTSGNDGTSPWPVSVGATVGLDRSRQITLCVGVDAQLLLDELVRVENTLEQVDAARKFGRRQWTRVDRLALGNSNSVVMDFTQMDLDRLSADRLLGIVEEYFAAKDSEVGRSMVLVFKSTGREKAREISRTLNAMRVDCRPALSVEELIVDVSNSPLLTSRRDANWFRLIKEVVEGVPQYPAELVDGKRGTDFANWLSGTLADQDFFAECDVRDISLALLAGRFGRNGEYQVRNASQRTLALARSAYANRALLALFGSLPITRDLIDLLVVSPQIQRYVAGLVSIEEMGCRIKPWFNEPVQYWRLGRPLTFYVKNLE